MWRAFFLAIGFFMMIVGVECLGVETVNLKIHDAPPAGLTVTSISPSLGLYSALTGDWDLGTIPANGSVTATAQARVDGHAPMTNTASVKSLDEPQVRNANDRAGATVTTTIWVSIGTQMVVSDYLACYNYFTPPHEPRNATNYVCGCVATAMSQLMYYFLYPQTGVGNACFQIATSSMTAPLMSPNTTSEG